MWRSTWLRYCLSVERSSFSSSPRLSHNRAASATVIRGALGRVDAASDLTLVQDEEGLGVLPDLEALVVAPTVDYWNGAISTGELMRRLQRLP